MKEGTHEIIHFSIEINYLLKRALEGKENNLLTDSKGKTLTPEEAVESLCKFKAKGFKYLTTGTCNHKNKDGSCAGHIKKNKEGKA